jgi:hypothetical protein
MTEEFNMGSLRKGPPMGKQEVPKKEEFTEKAVLALVKKAIVAHEEGTKRDSIDTKEWVDSVKAEVQRMIDAANYKTKDMNDKVRVPLATTWGALRKSMLGRYGGNHPLGDKRRQENGIALVETMDELLKMLLGDS